MKLGKYTITTKTISRKITEVRYGVNTKRYWDTQFKSHWNANAGPLQTTIFAAGFCLHVPSLSPSPQTILDYGAGTGDSAPILKMRFPTASISLWDFSEVARQEQRDKYLKVAQILDHEPTEVYDLVYSSNVIEHIEDKSAFVHHLAQRSKRYLVIQGPYEERHVSGAPITPDAPKGEHIWTIDKSILEILPSDFDWRMELFETPFAWNGPQFILIGIK